MIAPLRRAHCRIWMILPVLLYALLIAGLLERRSANPPNSDWHWEQIR